MLTASLGVAFLLAGLVLAAFAAAAGFAAGRARDPLLATVARRAQHASAAMVAGAVVVLEVALFRHEFQLAYVTEHSDRSLPGPLLAAALYGGQEGSLLYWTLALGGVGAAALAAAARAGAGVGLAAYATGFLAAVSTFFLAVLVFVASPFDVLPVAPADGLGLNPVLRDGGMLIHPPFLLAGFASFAVPFSFAMAALLAGRQDGAWIALTKGVALVAWGLQGTGLALGMWWAYHVLGWGGYWGWDPVENVALLPWLAVTAYLHSAQVEERRGGLRTWNIALVTVAFLLSVFGTFIVRSGILPSVHTFAVSPLGPWFFSFLAVAVVVGGGLLAGRGRRLAGAESGPEPGLTREGTLIAQNVLLVALGAAILWGTVLPLVSGLLGAQLVVGAPYYERVAGPLLLLILALLAAGPLVPWRRLHRAWAGDLRWPLAAGLAGGSALIALGERRPAPLLALTLVAAGLATCAVESARGLRLARRLAGPLPLAAARLAARNRRRYGAQLAHVGILAVAAGIAGSNLWQQQREVSLAPGQAAELAGYRLVFEGLEERRDAGHVAVLARLRVGGATLEPARLLYPGQGGQSLTRVAIRSTPRDDLYVVLSGTEGERAAIHLFVNPLVTWIWAGAALLIAGVLLGNLGSARLEPRAAAGAVPVPAPSARGA